MKSNKWNEHATRKLKRAKRRKEEQEWKRKKGEGTNKIVGAFTPIAIASTWIVRTRNAHEQNTKFLT